MHELEENKERWESTKGNVNSESELLMMIAPSAKDDESWKDVVCRVGTMQTPLQSFIETITQ